MRRVIVGGGCALIMALAAAMPAAAAGPAQVQSPFEGSTITSATRVEVRVEESCGALSQDTASSVDARLSLDGQEAFPGSGPASLQRTKACDSDGEYSDWGGVFVAPGSPTAFFGDDAAPMCNGRWRIQARVDGGAWSTGVSFTVSRTPAVPTGLTADPNGDQVQVSWDSNPEPDLAGYLVERRSAGASEWSEVATVTGTAVVDEGVPAGDWDYRVVALRGDGAGVPACEDTEPDLTAASAVETASVGEPEPDPSPSPSPGDSTDGDSTDGGTTGDDSTDGGTTDGGDGTATDGDGDTGQDPTVTSDGGATDGGTAGGDTTSDDGGSRRVGAPPPATRRNPELDSPELPGIESTAPRERYYGEGEGFNEELDFGSVEEVEGTETRSRTTTEAKTRLVPQAVQEFVSQYVDPNRVLKPIAAGLVLVALALHLRLWTREHDGFGR